MIKLKEDHPLFDDITSEALFLRTDSFVVFVCGALSTPAHKSARDVLMDYAHRHLKDFQFFRAEDALSQLTKRRKTDLLSIENRLAGYADCIVILLESPSAIAELGAFANLDPLAKIILAINDRSFRDSPSFINHGPLRRVASVSRFGAPLIASFASILECAPALEARLIAARRRRALRVSLRDYKSFRSALPKHRLLFVADIVSLLSPTTEVTLQSFFKRLYGRFPRGATDIDLGMLEALTLVYRSQGYILRSPSQDRQFYRYPLQHFASLRSLILRSYQNSQPQLIEILCREPRKCLT